MDDRFIDVDFTKDLRYTLGDLGARVFGSPSYEQLFGVMSDAEIRQAIEIMDAEGNAIDELVTRIFDQGREGACVANATCQAHEIVQARQFGIENVVHLSAISLYKRIGRSAQSGAVVSDGWEELRDRGVLPLDTPENRARFGEAVMPNTGFSTPFPGNWEQTAAKLKGCEAWPINTVEGLHTALCCGHPVVVGRQGHSICYVRPMIKSGGIIVKYANSWGDWGDNGFGYDTTNQIREAARWAFALRSVTVQR